MDTLALLLFLMLPWGFSSSAWAASTIDLMSFHLKHSKIYLFCPVQLPGTHTRGSAAGVCRAHGRERLRNLQPIHTQHWQVPETQPLPHLSVCKSKMPVLRTKIIMIVKLINFFVLQLILNAILDILHIHLLQFLAIHQDALTFDESGAVFFP